MRRHTMRWVTMNCSLWTFRVPRRGQTVRCVRAVNQTVGGMLDQSRARALRCVHPGKTHAVWNCIVYIPTVDSGGFEGTWPVKKAVSVGQWRLPLKYESLTRADRVEMELQWRPRGNAHVLSFTHSMTPDTVDNHWNKYVHPVENFWCVCWEPVFEMVDEAV